MTEVSECPSDFKVEPPPQEDLKATTYILCWNCSFYTKCPAAMLWCTNLCLCCCCTINAKGGCTCKEMDSCSASHGFYTCCPTSERKSQGCSKAPCFRDVYRGVMCYCMKCDRELDCRCPRTFFKCANQCCCCDTRCAFPCDQDIPCGCALCGWYCKKPDLPDYWIGNARD